MNTNPFETKITFDWKDLHKKVFEVIYIPPNPEVLEPIGQVYLHDGKGKFYLIKEFTDDQRSR